MTKRTRLNLYKLAVLAMAVLVLMLPNNISTLPEIDMRVLVTAFGVDSEGDDLVVSAQIVIPSPAGTTGNKQEVVWADGTSLASAINNLSARIGRKLDLGTCTVFVMGEELCKKGVTKTVEHLVAGNVVSPGASLLATNKISAKDLLVGLNDLSQAMGAEIPTFVQYVDQGAHVATLTLKDFLSRTNTVSGSTFIPVMEINEKQDPLEGVKKALEDAKPSFMDDQQGGGRGGSDSQSGGADGAQPMLKKFNTVKIFEHGKEVAILPKHESEGLAWLDKKAIKGVLETDSFDIDGKTQKYYAQLKYKRSSRKVSMYNGKPMVTVSLTVYLNISDNQALMGDDFNPREVKADSDRLKEEFAKKIEKLLNNSVIASKREGADFLLLKDDFYRLKNKEYKKYEKEHPDSFLRDVLVEYKINIKIH